MKFFNLKRTLALGCALLLTTPLSFADFTDVKTLSKDRLKLYDSLETVMMYGDHSVYNYMGELFLKDGLVQLIGFAQDVKKKDDKPHHSARFLAVVQNIDGKPQVLAQNLRALPQKKNFPFRDNQHYKDVNLNFIKPQESNNAFRLDIEQSAFYFEFDENLDNYVLYKAENKAKDWLMLKQGFQGYHVIEHHNKPNQKEAFWPCGAITVNTFNYKLFPQTLEEVKRIASNYEKMEDYAFTHRTPALKINGLAKETLDVYSAPSKNSYRDGKGKASMGLNGTFDVIGKVGDWQMVSYAINESRGRVGFVQSEKIANEAKNLSELNLSMEDGFETVADTYITLDPDFYQTPIMKLKKDIIPDDINVVGRYDAYYALCKFQMNGKEAFGFIPFMHILLGNG